MSFALWPWTKSVDTNEVLADALTVPADHPLLDVFADDMVQNAREAFRSTMRVEDRCQQQLLLCIGLVSLMVAAWDVLPVRPLGSLILVTLAILILLKARFPFDRPLGLKWPFIANNLVQTSMGHDHRARSAYLQVLEHHRIQNALSRHLIASLSLLAAAAFACVAQITYAVLAVV